METTYVNAARHGLDADITSQDFAANLFDRYSALLEAIVQLSKAAGFETVAFRNRATSKFPELSEKAQVQLVDRIITQRDIALSAVENGIDLRTGGHPLAWWAIKSFNLRPMSDAFGYLQKDDIVEIYDNDHVQIFRTFNFLKCTSYSLDEVYTHAWWDLFERDQQISKDIIALAGDLVRQQKPFTVAKPFPDHDVNEKFSPRLINAQIESRVVSSLVNADGVPKGYIHAFGLKSLNFRN